MKKKLILMALCVIVLGVGFFYLAFKGVYGEAVLHSTVFPYQVQFVSDTEAVSYECDAAECSYALGIGDYELFIDKQGYYVVQDSFSLEKDDVYEFVVELEVIPDLVESELTVSEVDEALFDMCYRDAAVCDLDDLFSLVEDSDTGYVTLWEGEVRRATFTKGMRDGMVFVRPDLNGALVYDAESFDAYFVNFLEDTRTYLFTLEDLNEVMFAEDGYVVDVGTLYWWRDDELISLPFNWGLSQLTYMGDRLYFLAEASELGDDVSAEGVVVGSYDGSSVYVIVDGLDIEIENSVMASDGESVYVKSGDEVFELRE